jgi:hypothetical protein
MRGCRADAEAVQQLLQDLGVRWAASVVTLDASARSSVRRKRETKKVLVVKHEHNLGSELQKSLIEAKPASPKKKRLFMADLDESQLTCDVCYKIFTKLYRLKNHQLIHLGRQEIFSSIPKYRKRSLRPETKTSVSLA